MEFPCYVPLYTHATHRPGYGDDVAVVENAIAARMRRADQHGNKIKVRNGASGWILEAGENAEML